MASNGIAAATNTRRRIRCKSTSHATSFGLKPIRSSIFMEPKKHIIEELQAKFLASGEPNKELILVAKRNWARALRNRLRAQKRVEKVEKLRKAAYKNLQDRKLREFQASEHVVEVAGRASFTWPGTGKWMTSKTETSILFIPLEKRQYDALMFEGKKERLANAPRTPR